MLCFLNQIFHVIYSRLLCQFTITVHTVSIRGSNKLNLVMVVWFQAKAKFHYCPSVSKNTTSVKSDSKIIFVQAESLNHSVPYIIFFPKEETTICVHQLTFSDLTPNKFQTSSALSISLIISVEQVHCKKQIVICGPFLYGWSTRCSKSCIWYGSNKNCRLVGKKISRLTSNLWDAAGRK